MSCDCDWERLNINPVGYTPTGREQHEWYCSFCKSRRVSSKYPYKRSVEEDQYECIRPTD